MVIIGRRNSKSTFSAYKRVRSEIAKQSSILGSKIKHLSLEVFGFNSFQIHVEMNIQTSQELRMLSRSPSDCKSLLLNVMIQVSQFVSKSVSLSHCTNSLNRS